MARSHSHHRAHRRRKQTPGIARVAIVGAAIGATGVVAAALFVAVRSPGDPVEPAPRIMAARTGAPGLQSSAPRDPIDARRIPSQLKTGDRIDVTTPEGFSYSLAAVEAGTSERPLASTRTTPPP